MQPQHQEPSPIGYSHDALTSAADEANLFQVEEAVSVEETTIRDIESREELEELLSQSIAAPNDEDDAVAEKQGVEDEGEPLDTLDALLAESIAELEGKRKLRELRQRAVKPGLSTRERQEIEAKVREWEARIEWQDEANVALFTRQLCAHCGTVAFPFNSMLRRQSHKTVKSSMRWITVEDLNPHLPREAVLRDRTVPFCQVCAEDSNWRLDTAQVLIHKEG